MTRANEPAYPAPPIYGHDGCGLVQGSNGLTLREHFAGLAMQGMLASNAPLSAEQIATYAPAYADALLAELTKESP